MLDVYIIAYLLFLILMLFILVWLDYIRIKNLNSLISVYRKQLINTPIHKFISTPGCYACAYPDADNKALVNEPILHTSAYVNLCISCSTKLKKNNDIKILYINNSYNNTVEHWSKHYDANTAHSVFMDTFKIKQPGLKLIKEKKDE
jgi:hypothetical protein